MIFKLYSMVTQDASLTDAEIKETYQKENEEISVSYIAGLAGEFTKDVTASGEEIKDYFAKNSFEFKQPLSFNLEYISLPSEDNEKGKTEDKISKIALQINKKEPFAKVAADFGLTLKETGIFKQTDPIPGIGWSPQVLNLISKARPQEFLPPVHLDKNYYIIRMKERKEPYVPEFEAIQDKIKDAVLVDKAKTIVKNKMESCLKELTDANTANPKEIDFDKIANKYGLKSSSTGLFKYGSYIEGIGASDIFWVTARGLKEGAFSQIIDMPSGSYIIKPKSSQPIDEEKFAKEKPDFAKKLLEQKKQEYFAKFFTELRKKAQSF